jgi:PEP-CTERM motif
MKKTRKAPLFVGVFAVVTLAAHAGIITTAGVAPNPGGPVVVTNSTSATISYIDTPVTQRVDFYSTTLLALLNGNQVFSQTFLLPFGDAAVQAAIAQADAILAGGGASFGAPFLFSNMSALQSSVTASPPTSTCLIESSIPLNSHATGVTTVTTTNTFGPNTVMVGECQSDTFSVLSTQLDININTDFVYAVPRNIVTTNTFLTTQTYEITGTTPNSSVPEPATSGLLLLGLGTVACCRRRRFSQQ